MKNRRFGLWPATTSPRTRHNGATAAESAESPQPPHAATVTTFPPLAAPQPFAALYPYLPTTIEQIRGFIDQCRSEADQDEAAARHKRETADDYERLLALVAEDARRQIRQQAGPQGAPVSEGWRPQPKVLVHLSREPRVLDAQPSAACGTPSPQWMTPHTADVTCLTCIGLIDELDEGWAEPQLPDTLTMPAVGAR